MKQYIFGGSGDALNNSVTEYLPLTSTSRWNATEDDSRCIAPCAGTLSNFRADLGYDPGSGGDGFNFKIRVNGAEPANTLSITIDEPAIQGSDLVNTVTISAGDVISVECSPNVSPTALRVGWTLDFDTDDTNKAALFGGSDDDLSTNVATYNFLSGSHDTWGSSSVVGQVMPCAGTLKNLYVQAASTVGGGGKQYVFLVEKAAAGSTSWTSTGITVTAVDDGQVSDLGNTYGASAGEKFRLKCTPSNSPNAVPFAWGIEFDPTTDGDSPVMGGTNNDYHTSSTEYILPNASGESWAGDINFSTPLVGEFSAKNLYFEIFTAPTGATKSITLSVQDDGANILAVTLTDTDKTGNDISSALVASGSGVRMKALPANSPSTADSAWGFVAFTAVQVNVNVTPSALALTLTDEVPTITAVQVVNVTPAALALTLTDEIPTIATQTNVNITPTTLALTLTVETPSIDITGIVNVTPNTLALTTSIETPTITAVKTINVVPDALALTVSVEAPSISTGTGVTVSPSTLSLTSTIETPTIAAQTNMNISPSTLALTVTIETPTITIPVNIIDPISVLTVAQDTSSIDEDENRSLLTLTERKSTLVVDDQTSLLTIGAGHTSTIE